MIILEHPLNNLTKADDFLIATLFPSVVYRSD